MDTGEQLDLTPGVQSFPHPGPNSKGVFIFSDMNGNKWTNQNEDDGGSQWRQLSSNILSDFPDIEKNAVRKTKNYRPITELQAIRALRVNDVINDVTYRI